MKRNIDRILALEVPIIVQLGQRQMPLGEVISLIPGAIIELPKAAHEELELLVNNKVVGVGVAVKVGENFGIRLSYIGKAEDRIRALGQSSGTASGTTQNADEDLAALAAEMLAGQT